MIEKGGFPHFMLKEIFEQPETIRNATRGRLVYETGEAHLGGLDQRDGQTPRINRIVLLACGTSWHAGFDRRVHDRGTRARARRSGVRFRVPLPEPDHRTGHGNRGDQPVGRDDRYAGSDAGSQAKGVDGARHLQCRWEHDCPRERERCLYSCRSRDRRGVHKGVYDTDNRFGALGAPPWADACDVQSARARRSSRRCTRCPNRSRRFWIRTTRSTRWRKSTATIPISSIWAGETNFPVALEGALKLKEISYVHAEGYPAAEMKHGPIALIDKNMPVVVICPERQRVQKNPREYRRGQGQKRAVDRDRERRRLEASKVADSVITIPKTLDMLYPILTVIPLQLLAYHIAVLRGCDVDQPRNLAKSVTVE